MYVSSKYSSTGEWGLVYFRMRMPNNSKNQRCPVAQSFDFSFYPFCIFNDAILTFLFQLFSADFKAPFETIEQYVDEM